MESQCQQRKRLKLQDKDLRASFYRPSFFYLFRCVLVAMSLKKPKRNPLFGRSCFAVVDCASFSSWWKIGKCKHVFKSLFILFSGWCIVLMLTLCHTSIIPKTRWNSWCMVCLVGGSLLAIRLQQLATVLAFNNPNGAMGLNTCGWKFCSN